MIDTKIWDDQREFNAQLRPLPTDYEGRMALTKEFMLHMMAECGSVLDASGAWKMHRREVIPENRERIKMELIDVFKYWLSIAQAQGFTAKELADAYWWKSAAVRQHYVEEFISQLDRPMVILDLDNVLCDYLTGFCNWLIAACRLGSFNIRPQHIERVRTERPYINAESLDITEREWRTIKHAFRTTGGKRSLPPMPGATNFARWCYSQGWAVVILTSRPIDSYPNIYLDTVDWLNQYGIRSDYIWWGVEKGEKIIEVMSRMDVTPHIKFAVDDDPKFIGQYNRAKIPSYWLNRTPNRVLSGLESRLVRVVNELDEIIRREGEEPWDTATQDTGHTHTTTENTRSIESTVDPTLFA